MSTEERVTSDSGGEKGRKMAEVGAIDAVARAINKAVESLVFCIFIVAVFAVGRYYDAIPRGIAYGLSIAVFGVGAMSIAMLRQATKSLRRIGSRFAQLREVQ